MKKLIFLLILILAGFVVGRFTIDHLGNTNTLSLQKTVSPVITSKTTASIGVIPIKLSIPVINVSATIESVGMDSQGRMDVPRKDDNAAWYNLGFKPGDKGSAVIDGHFDKASGQPAVFYKLSSLKAGATISVIGKNGEKLNFVVTKLQYYDFDKFPLQEVFNTTDKPRLNLITCDGAWDEKTKNYTKRLVVYSERASL